MSGPQRVVIAPDSFKGSLAAPEVAGAIARGWQREAPDDEIVQRPLADGGEGTLDAFLAAIPGAQRRRIRVTGADGQPSDGSWVWLPPGAETPGGTGVVELASACGIETLGGRLRPWDAGTEGLGEAICAALDSGVTRLIVGLGSSASSDGGAGMLRALGAGTRDARGLPVAPGLRGLREVAEVDLSGLRSAPSGGVIVLADVDNPLCGPRGAAAVFGPQKGLLQAEIADADASLAAWARHIPAPADAPGAGAAGGTGFALRAWGGEIESGAAYVAEVVGLSALLTADTIVVTGEGAYDAGTASGKAPQVVIQLARSAGARAALVAGRIDPGAELSELAAAVSLTELARGAASALAAPRHYLELAGQALARQLSASR